MKVKYLLGLVGSIYFSVFGSQAPSMDLTYQKDIEAGTLSASNATTIFNYYRDNPEKFSEIAETLMKNGKVILQRAEEVSNRATATTDDVGHALAGLLLLSMFYNHGPQFVKQFEDAQNGAFLNGFCKMFSVYLYREKEPLAQKFGFSAIKALIDKNFAAAVSLQRGDVEAQPLVAFPVLRASQRRAHAAQMPSQLTYDFQPRG